MLQSVGGFGEIKGNVSDFAVKFQRLIPAVGDKSEIIPKNSEKQNRLATSPVNVFRDEIAHNQCQIGLG